MSEPGIGQALSVNEAKEAWIEELAATVQEDAALLKDSSRCESLLRDLLPGDENRKNVTALKLAVKQEIPSLLEEDRARGEKQEHSLVRITKNFESATGLSTGMAEWSVRVWSVAIGWGAGVPTTIPGKKTVAGHTPPSTTTHSGGSFDLEACILSAERGSVSSQLYLGDV